MQHKDKKIQYLSKKTGSLIKKLREKLTAKSLNIFALENDISRGHLSRLENGANDPKLSTLWKVAEGLNMPLSEFIRILENELPENWNISDE